MPDGGAIALDGYDLTLAAGLVLLAGVVSLVLRVGMERRLFVAALRTVVQLLLVGYVLRVVFDLDQAWAVLGVAIVMLGAASFEAVRRPRHAMAGTTGRAFVTLLASALLTTVLVTSIVIRVEPWYAPQYLIPLLGMALGNSLTGLSLCLDQLLSTFAERRADVESDLALGASRWEAARRPLAEAIRRGLIPIVNSMSVAGIVSLPGMMTGQILAGADPVDAVRYQVVVMFLIAASTSLGCMAIGLLVVRALFNERHQLRSERIRERS